MKPLVLQNISFFTEKIKQFYFSQNRKYALYPTSSRLLTRPLLPAVTTAASCCSPACTRHVLTAHHRTTPLLATSTAARRPPRRRRWFARSASTRCHPSRARQQWNSFLHVVRNGFGPPVGCREKSFVMSNSPPPPPVNSTLRKTFHESLYIFTPSKYFIMSFPPPCKFDILVKSICV